MDEEYKKSLLKYLISAATKSARSGSIHEIMESIKGATNVFGKVMKQWNELSPGKKAVTGAAVGAAIPPVGTAMLANAAGQALGNKIENTKMGPPVNANQSPNIPLPQMPQSAPVQNAGMPFGDGSKWDGSRSLGRGWGEPGKSSRPLPPQYPQ